MANDSFAKQIEAWSKKTDEAVLQWFREAVIEIGTRLITRTPIKTGRAQGSWVSTVNVPASGEAPHRDPEAAIAELHVMAARLTLGDVANIFSTLNYMPELEYGHSKQAPHGMVRITAEEWGQIVSEARAKVRAKLG